MKLTDLAAIHGMSVRSLSRHFKQMFGSTVLGYVSGRRINSARAALERDEFTLDQAAYVAGFDHTANFSTAFRKRYGYPQAQFGADEDRRLWDALEMRVVFEGRDKEVSGRSSTYQKENQMRVTCW